MQWYGKTHLVMFGEYIPLASYIPGLREYIRSIGMGLTQGPGAQRLMVKDTAVSPSICIETAVERVTVNQLRELRAAGGMPDVLVTVTNDGWFDDSSVIDHHLRCANWWRWPVADRCFPRPTTVLRLGSIAMGKSSSGYRPDRPAT